MLSSQRWAAKEAIIKASLRKIYMKDIVIYKSSNGPVGVILDQGGEEPSALDDDVNSLSAFNGQTVALSISHDGEYAIATAMVPISSDQGVSPLPP